MSNTLAIAAVTATLRYLLHEALRAEPDAVSGAHVTTHHPARLTAANTAATGINVFLYEASLDSAARHHEVPIRSPGQEIPERLPAAVDLQYLLSCYGNDDSLDPERHLARAIDAIVSNPILSAEVIAAAIAAYAAEPTAFLPHADLADQVERVRLTIRTLTITETSLLWSIIGTPYLPSIVCTASAVLL
ncbi:MAG: DUF4255 domain-containing protein [Actinomycetota bacterium]